MAFLNPDTSTDPESLSPWILRLVLNSAAVTVKGVMMEQIANTIRTRYNTDGEVIFADIYSDDNAPTLVLRIGLINDPDENPVDQSAMGLGANMTMSSPDNEFLQRVEAALLDDLCLGGIPGISKVYIRDEKVQRWVEDKDEGGNPIPNTGRFETKTEWLLDTDGTNLLEVLGHPDVDHTSTFSNDIVEICDTLGIEAVRKSILRGAFFFYYYFLNYLF